MSATRNRVVVVCRDTSSPNRMVRVERRSFGTERNLQRQCSTGELEFDSTEKRFVFVKKDARRPFAVPKESMDMDFFPITRTVG